MTRKGPSILSVPPLWRESRLGFEAAALMRDPVFRGHDVEEGSDQPVMLIPGFMAGDGSLGIMTRWLRRTGHRTRKAGMRANVDCSEAVARRLEATLEAMVEASGQRVAIIGQSRGGSFGRVLAVRRPDLVSGIINLGSPTTRQLDLHPLVQLQVLAVGLLGTIGVPGFFSARCLLGGCCTNFWEDLAGPFPDEVGFLSIYSKSDGVVNWEACVDDAADRTVEIHASHIGMAVNAAGYREIAAALARFRAADLKRDEHETRPRRKRRGRSVRLVHAA